MSLFGCFVVGISAALLLLVGVRRVTRGGKMCLDVTRLGRVDADVLLLFDFMACLLRIVTSQVSFYDTQRPVIGLASG